MNVVRTEAEARAALSSPRRAGAAIALVPTMGALHAGHLSLVRAARAECDVVVVSIFVNPLQFGPGEDYDAYPRPERDDLEAAAGEGVDVVFSPPAAAVYGPGHATTVAVAGIGDVLEGEARPGHFTGVATIVAKLLNIVGPDRAYFGRKDAQQAAVIKRMVADLSWPVEIVVCPTVREPSGLALSSRNAYLSAAERDRAAILYGALDAGRRALQEGGGPAAAELAMTQAVAGEDGVELGYARAVDPDDFTAPRPEGPVLLVIAARIGGARLIDNVLVDAPATA